MFERRLNSLTRLVPFAQRWWEHRIRVLYARETLSLGINDKFWSWLDIFGNLDSLGSIENFDLLFLVGVQIGRCLDKVLFVLLVHFEGLLRCKVNPLVVVVKQQATCL